MLIEHNHDAKRRVSKSNVVSYVVLVTRTAVVLYRWLWVLSVRITRPEASR